MKTSMKKLALTIGAFGCLTFAQAQKIAHLSYDSLISLMPETKTATEAAQNFLKGLEQELVAMQTEMDGKYKDYLEKEPTMSEMIKKNKQEDLQQLQTRIQDFQRQAENEYKRKQAELTLPIMQKAKKGIEAVAKENAYKYVVDTSPQSTAVLYSEPSDDILVLVKKKLDSMPLANIPGIGGPGTGGIKPVPPAKNNTNAPPQKTNK